MQKIQVSDEIVKELQGLSLEVDSRKVLLKV